MRYLWLGVLIIFLFPYSMIFSGPGLMGLLTLVVSFLSSLLVGLTRSTWYGISVWLVYISGMLVLFLFFCSLSPNPSFYSPYGVFMSFFLGLGYFVSIYFFFKMGSSFDNIMFGNFWGLQPFFLLVEGGPFIYSWLGAYLFFVMILVVKLSPKMGGAVRSV